MDYLFRLSRRLLSMAKRNQTPLGIMVIDIDRFHEVNQSLGHVCGDELLRQVAGRLSGSLRESDVLGRLGGDVFGIILPEVADREQAAIVAADEKKRLDEQAKVKNRELAMLDRQKRQAAWEARCDIKPVMSDEEIATCKEVRSRPAP